MQLDRSGAFTNDDQPGSRASFLTDRKIDPEAEEPEIGIAPLCGNVILAGQGEPVSLVYPDMQTGFGVDGGHTPVYLGVFFTPFIHLAIPFIVQTVILRGNLFAVVTIVSPQTDKRG